MKSETKYLKSVFFVLCTLLVVNVVHVELKAMQVTEGTADISRSGAVVNVRTHTNKTTIIHENLNVPKNGEFNIFQPNNRSHTFNYASEQIIVEGKVWSNGKVSLISPNRVIFGENAVVNVGTLIAGAAQIGDENHLNITTGFVENFGKLKAIDAIHLIGDSVLNAGQIHAPVVNLIGRYVLNSGTIHAPDGMIGIMVADEVYLGKKGSQIFVNLGAQGDPANNTRIENTGTLDAGKGSVYLGAGDMYSLAIRNSGVIKAKEITLDAGDAGIVSVEDGTLDASHSGGLGGSITVLGETIGLFGNTVINASGAVGGGTVNIGGGFQGNDPDLRNATLTYVANGVTIQADALDAGNGGEIIVWSDGLTWFDGRISAHGGKNGGDGGFAEVSGKNALQWRDNASANLSAVAGTAGELLLDPATLTIVEDREAADIDGDGSLGDDITSIEDLDGIDPDAAAADANSIISNDAVIDLLTDESGNLILFADELIKVNAVLDIIDISPTGDLTFQTQQLDINAEIGSSVGASFEPADPDSPVVVNVGTEDLSTSAVIDILGSSATNTFAVTVNNGSTLSGTVTTGSGNDTLTLADGAYVDNINTGPGNDTVTLADGAYVGDNVFTGTGDDVVTLQEGASLTDLWTEEGDDTVTIADGASIDVYLDTDEGDDTVIIASGGAVWSDSGSDYFSTGTGDDTVILNEGARTVDFETGDGNDEVHILGGDLANTFFNYLDTGDGDDTVLITGTLSDFTEGVEYASIYTGSDDDTIRFSGTTNFIGNIYMEDGNDTVLPSGTTTTLGFEGEGLIDTGADDDTIEFSVSTNFIGNIYMNTGNDMVLFSGATTTLGYGGEGIIEAGPGDDIFVFNDEATLDGRIDGDGYSNGEVYEISVNEDQVYEDDYGFGFDTLDFTASSLATEVNPGGKGPVITYDEETSGVTIPNSVISGGYDNINEVLLPEVTETLIPPTTDVDHDEELSGFLVEENPLEIAVLDDPIEDAMINQLAEMGIYARNNTPEENLQRFGGSTQFLQLIGNKQPQLSDYKVAVGRTGKARIMSILDAYRSLLGSDDFDAGIEQVQDVLDQAFEEYYENSEDAITGPGMRAYIEGHQDDELHAQALQYLNGYRNLFAKIKTSGLTPNEIEISKSVLLRRIRISDFTSKELYEAIEADSGVKL